ncbi:MAG: hypothetical protein GXP24_05710 [Planctomycetes bacterium]|nr:hypothetical protein [Planctomycetota bacterium]
MSRWIERAALLIGLRIDQVERGLFSRLLSLGFALLAAHVAKFGCGDAGETVEREGRTLRHSALATVCVDLWGTEDRAIRLRCPTQTENRTYSGR